MLGGKQSDLKAVMSDRAKKVQTDWQRERPDINADVMALVGRLLEAAHVLEREWLSPLAQRYELQPGEFDVIATLRRSGPPYALTPTALYESLMLSSGAMTNRLDRLERRGLIERQRSTSDRRSVTVQLTRHGLELIDELLPIHVANEEQAMASLSSKDQKNLDRLLQQLLSGLQHQPTTAPKPSTD